FWCFIRFVFSVILIKLHKGLSLLMVDLEPISDGIFPVIFPLYQSFTGNIITSGFLWGIVDNMVNPTGRFMNPPATESRYNLFIFNRNFNDSINTDICVY